MGPSSSPDDPPSLLRDDGGVFLDSVSVSRGGSEVLRNLTLSLPSGGITTVLGRSGVGKTTLLKAIMGLLPLASGSIATARGSLSDPAILKEHRRRTAVVFQENALIDRLSAIDNVLLGLADRRSPFDPRPWPHAMRHAAAVALDRVEMLDCAHRPVFSLSGGQRQRVGIARALVREPRLFVADEPFNGLDPLLSRKLIRIMQENVTRLRAAAILVLHNVQVALEISERIVVLSDGRVVFDGAPSQIRETSSNDRLLAMMKDERHMEGVER